MCYFPRDLTNTPTDPTPEPAVQWEESNCLLCGGKRWQTLLEAPDNQANAGLWFAVVQCNDCGLCFTNPRPRFDNVDQFYPIDYRPHQLQAEKPRWSWWQSVRQLWGERPPLAWHGQGRLLDFGCGGGAFLRQMRRHGWDVTGIDTSLETIARVREETGLNLLFGTLPHPELAAQSFDVITMWHALEHVHDPRAVLQAARRLLAPDGKLIVVVPNIDSLAFRLFGHAWFALDLPRHLVHFAPWTLHVMLERAGFRVVRIKMVRHSAWLRHSARLACQSPEADSVHRLLRTKPFSRLAALYSCLTSQSDCIMAIASPAQRSLLG